MPILFISLSLIFVFLQSLHLLKVLHSHDVNHLTCAILETLFMKQDIVFYSEFFLGKKEKKGMKLKIINSSPLRNNIFEHFYRTIVADIRMNFLSQYIFKK